MTEELARRSFLSRLTTGAASVGAAFGLAVRPVQAQTGGVTAGPFQPARHAEDDWFDTPGVKHRFFMDTTSAMAIGQAIFFANNYYTANRSGYNLTDADSAVIIGVRHQSTAFAYTDAMWAKYGEPLAERAAFSDPKTKQAPKVNVYLASGYGTELPNQNVTLDAVVRRGLRISVCSLATRANATLIAQRTGGDANAIFKELTENLVPNARMVPAGIVAVGRAQERGYTFGYVQ